MRSALTQGTAYQQLSELSRTVQGEAEAEARQMLNDARARAEAIRQEAQKRAAVARSEILAGARSEAEPFLGQAQASAQLEAQRLRLESREQLLARVFSEARVEFERAAQQPDYPGVLHRFIREAVANLATDEVILRTDARTQQYLTDTYLSELGNQLEVNLRRGKILASETGIVAESANGHRRYRNTLEAQLDRIEGTLRRSVYVLLRGDAL